MSTKRWRDGRWVIDSYNGKFRYLKPGYCEDTPVMEEPEFLHSIPIDEANQLVAYMKEQGYIRPEMPYDRKEDVKIINRLIDVIEKVANEVKA